MSKTHPMRVAVPEMPWKRLTNREKEVLRLCARGKTSREIGQELYLSPHTIRDHRVNIIRKMNASNITEAVAIGIRKHII